MSCRPAPAGARTKPQRGFPFFENGRAQRPRPRGGGCGSANALDAMFNDGRSKPLPYERAERFVRIQKRDVEAPSPTRPLKTPIPPRFPAFSANFIKIYQFCLHFFVVPIDKLVLANYNEV